MNANNVIIIKVSGYNLLYHLIDTRRIYNWTNIIYLYIIVLTPKVEILTFYYCLVLFFLFCFSKNLLSSETYGNARVIF